MSLKFKITETIIIIGSLACLFIGNYINNGGLMFWSLFTINVGSTLNITTNELIKKKSEKVSL